jgi:hypothetical protein
MEHWVKQLEIDNIINACKLGNFNLVDNFLKDCVKTKKCVCVGNFEDILYWALRVGNLNIVTRLLEHTSCGVINCSCENYKGLTLKVASRKGHLEVVKLLLGVPTELGTRVPTELGTRVPTEELDTIALNHALLYSICNGGHYDIVKILLERGVDVHMSDIAFEWSAFFGYMEIIKLFIEWGANVNKIQEPNLVKIIRDNNNDLMELILRKGLVYKGNNKIILNHVKEYQLKCVCYAELNRVIPNELLNSIALYI